MIHVRTFFGRRLVPGFVVLACVLGSAGCGTRESDEEFAAVMNGTGPGAAQTPTAPIDGDLSGQPASQVGSTSPSGVAAPASSATTPANAGLAEPGSAPNASSVKTDPAAAANHPQAVNRPEIAIGIIGPWSGVLGALGKGVPPTLRAWAAYTNAHGGLNGHPIRVVVGDDQADPGTAMTLARRMVEQDKIIAMVNPIEPFAANQLEQYMREKAIPIIGTEAGSPIWFNSPITFPISTSLARQVVGTLEAVVKRGTKKLAVFTCVEVAQLCAYLQDQVLKSEAGPYVETYQVSLVAPSYTSQCLRMKQNGVEMLFMLMDTAAAARAARDCATQGFTPKLGLLGLDATSDLPGIPELAAAEMPGATVSAGATGVPGLAKFHQVMQTYAPSVGDSGLGVLTWAAAEMFGLVGRNLSADAKPAELLEALWKVRNETLGGLTVPLTYPKNRPVEIKDCFFIWGVENGKYSAPQGAKPIC